MRKFDDPKRAATYKERCSSGKLAKSGKRYVREELREIASDEEFCKYISAIGFEWLLKHSDAEVPEPLAREFFSTFRLKTTTDLDADSITFRLFTEEHEMSIRDWSLRMGLFTRKEDDEGVWNDSVVGPPRYTPGFKPQSAWEFVTHPKVGQFKTSCSKAFHIDNRILRFAQTFVSYNLMGTANSALTTADLYFTWCMAKGVKVHLGYWLAQACHQMAANPSRHMYTCHLLGAYLQRNSIMKIAKSAPEIRFCEPPEIFSVEYFFNKGLLYMHGKEVCFYEVGRAESQVKAEPESVEAGAKIEVEEMRTEVGWMRSEIKMVREEMVALRGSITDLVEKTSVHGERMADAVQLMKMMAQWLKEKFPEPLKKVPTGPSNVPKPLGQGSVSSQQPPQSSKPLTAPSASKAVIMKKSVPTPSKTEKETPDSPARKKAKVTRPYVPPQFGSRGGQTPN